MAAAMEMLQELQSKITCSICRSYFSEPVTLECGHSFCRACLCWSWRIGAPAFSCPKCRQVSQVREFPVVNRHLAQLTDLEKQLSSQLLQSIQGQSQCVRHKEVFKLFCEDDQTPLCVRCSQSPEHGAHMICPIEVAAHNCREKLQHIQSHLGKCFEESKKLLAQEKPAVDWHWRIGVEYNKLHCFLMEEESRCLGKIKQEQRASEDRLSQHIQSLQDLMLELQEADHQPNVDLLQDVKQLLRRSESVLSQRSKAVLPELREYPIPGMIELLSRFRVDITMNPGPTSPCVTVSEDLKSVKAGEAWQAGTKQPEDLTFYAVLAKQAFSSGRQYWEVDVTQLPQWVLGIYTPYLRRKRRRNVDSCDSVFLLQCVKKEEDYCFQTYPGPLKHRMKGSVPRVGVYLEYSSGTLVFYNVLQSSLIYRFDSISFAAPVTPIFSPGPPLPGIKAGKTCEPTTRLPDYGPLISSLPLQEDDHHLLHDEREAPWSSRRPAFHTAS
ncbi:tripartite motif-containing protein 64-like [Vombatus ursinus]|uniref:tripartite motif-containing protein 64-like n=1 Tax=Vombatus ursinus TaxID=29139 RepID=UPI000FFD14D9|nr:tripartite motif-containing protein 64-like [Vombatus ursinus]